jgi:transposase
MHAMRLIERLGIKETARRMEISRVTLWRWRRFGVNRRNRPTKEDAMYMVIKPTVGRYVASFPFCTVRDVVLYVRQEHHCKLCAKTVRRCMKELNLTRKRTRLRGVPRGDIEALKAAFHTSFQSVSTTSQPKDLISVDECGFSERLRPTMGYSRKGEPVIAKIKGSWVHHSLLLAVCADGTVCGQVIRRGAINKVDFAAFLTQFSPHATVLLDNASIHKRLDASVRCRLCYTPPYSPEYNPIELVFAWVKRRFRRELAERELGAAQVPDVVASIIADIPASLVRNSFRHVHDVVRSRH